jgi:hypothetical protein
LLTPNSLCANYITFEACTCREGPPSVCLGAGCSSSDDN